RGAPALNLNLEAFLAFAGLSWDDVEKVQFPGWKQATEGVIAGQADAVIASTTSPPHQRLAASPRGNLHPTLPHGDTAGWERARAVMPIWNQRNISKGNGLENNMSGEVPYEGGGFPYPIYVTYPDRDEKFIYALTKAVAEHHKEIQEGFAPASGYAVESQVLSWVMPYHPGAIRYYKEVGAWTAEHDAHNDKLLKRQDVLAAAWKTVTDMNLSKDEHVAKWATVRAAALEAAGLSVPFRNF
ncbi:MAG: C4-dicarboxylate ABC transporter, partial [Gammaproteobacteria bacterium]|nr:C4-dicarboxylate ABC transporter [Gammaproteobacteria bacterium]